MTDTAGQLGEDKAAQTQPGCEVGDPRVNLKGGVEVIWEKVRGQVLVKAKCSN